MSDYDTKYVARGGHPGLLARRIRQTALEVEELQRQATTDAHPAVRPLVVERLGAAYGCLVDAMAMETKRVGDDWRAR